MAVFNRHIHWAVTCQRITLDCLFFEEDRRSDFIQEKFQGHYEAFTDALSIRDWGIGQLNIALISFSGSTIDYISLAKKGKQVVTSKCRVEFSGMVNIGAISIMDRESKLNERVQRYFVKASQGTGGVIPPATWIALIEAIKAERLLSSQLASIQGGLELEARNHSRCVT